MFEYIRKINSYEYATASWKNFAINRLVSLVYSSVWLAAAIFAAGVIVRIMSLCGYSFG